MRTILTDSSGDIARRPTRWAEGAEAVRVKLEYRLRTAVGEWMLDRSFGLDRDRVRDAFSDQAPLPPEVEVARVAAACPGVRRVVQVALRRPETAAEAQSLGLSTQWRQNPGRVARIDLVCEVLSEQEPVTFTFDQIFA